MFSILNEDTLVIISLLYNASIMYVVNWEMYVEGRHVHFRVPTQVLKVLKGL